MHNTRRDFHVVDEAECCVLRLASDERAQLGDKLGVGKVEGVDADGEYPSEQASEVDGLVAVLHEDVHLDVKGVALEQELVADEAHRAAVEDVARRDE